MCNDGYFLLADECKACSHGCKRCRGAAPSDCLACFFFYKVAPKHADGCVFSHATMVTVIITIACLGVGLALACRDRHRRAQQPPSISEYVGAGAPAAGSTQVLYPSGAWRGYYCAGRRQHGVVEFRLTFTVDVRSP